MGIFSFLSTEPQQEGEVDALKREQMDVKRSNAAKPPPPEEGALRELVPAAEAEDISPDASRRKFSEDESAVVQKEQDAIRRVKSAVEDSQRGLGGEFGNAKLMQFADALNKNMLNGDQIADDVETLLKDQKNLRPRTLQALASAVNDLKMAREARQKLEAGRSAVPAPNTVNPDVYSGHADEAFGKAKGLRDEASRLGILSRGDRLKEAQNLESQGASLKALGDEGRQAIVNAPPKPEGPTDIKTNLAASGKSDHDYTMAIVGAYRQLEQDYGFDIGDLNKRVAFSVAIRSLLPILDPTGRVTNELVAMSMQMNGPAKKEEKQKASVSGNIGAGAGAKMNAEVEDADTYEIREKQRMRRELFSQLNSAPETQNWLAAISAILLSCVIGSEKAMLYVFGRSSKNGTLSAQLQMLNREISEDMQMLREKRTQERETRKEAATRLQHERDRDQNYSRDIEKMYLNHKLILERAKANGSRENQQIVRKLEGDYNRVLRQMSEAEKIMNNNWVEDKDPKKITASREYDQLKREAQFLDQKLRALTEKIAPGTYGGEEEAP